MSFKHSCFISYARGTGILVSDFMIQLTRLLSASLAPYFGPTMDIFVDEDDLDFGHKHEKRLAQAICHSVCMIVVYTPTYGQHNFCLREYKMMEDLEEMRLKLTGLEGAGGGLIIPIIFRGEREQLPEKIAEHINYCDFSEFTTATGDISKKDEYVRDIERIARYVYNLWLELVKAPKDVCGDCGTRSLPDKNAITNWPLPSPTFPWR